MFFLFEVSSPWVVLCHTGLHIVTDSLEGCSVSVFRVKWFLIIDTAYTFQTTVTDYLSHGVMSQKI